MTRKIAMNTIRQVVQRLAQGYSFATIHRELKVSKGWISKIKAALEANNLSHEQFLGLTDPEIHHILYPPTSKARHEPDWAEVNRHLKMNHMTLSLAYDHYRANCTDQNPYSYSSYCRLFDEWKQGHLPLDTFNNLDVVPGDSMEIDFAGDPLIWVDQHSETHKARLFVATLPYSGLIYSQVFPNEKQDAWIQGILEALEYFGGVPNNLVMDNAKALVIRADRNYGIIQPVILDICSHYDMQAITCAPASPKQKNRVEASVCMVERWITGKLQLKQIGGVLAANEEQLKKMVRECLDALNDRPWRGRGETRKACFLAEEKSYIKPLPPYPYDFGKWKALKADKGHCIRISEDGGHRYSVPYQFAFKKTHVKLTKSHVKIFDQESGVLLATHERRYNATGEKTHLLNEHLSPEEKKTRLTPEQWITYFHQQLGISEAICTTFVLNAFKSQLYGFRLCRYVRGLRSEFSTKTIEKAMLACNETGIHTVPFLKNQCIEIKMIDRGASLFENIGDQQEPNYLTALHENIRNDYE